MKKFGSLWWIHFKGFGAKEHDDNWVAFFLGWTELLIGPFMLHADRVDIIGAWFVFKTLPSWKTWTEKRNSYNRFLLFSVINLGICWLLADKFITS
jgi:hypothetical protein